MADMFEVKYEVDDGYAGKSRPQRAMISANEIDEDMTDESLEELMYEMAHQDMLCKVSAAVSTSPAEFIQWARAVSKAR